MPWYAASVIIALDPVAERSDPDQFLFWENVYLVNEADEERAWSEAERIGRLLNDNKPPLVMDGKEVTLRYCSVRKLLSVDPYPYGTDVSSPAAILETGSEVSFNLYAVKSAQDIAALISGESVALTYIE